MSALGLHSLSRQQSRTRAAIQAAFLDLLFENNYPAVTMAAVAARADVGRSTLYEHFRTKDDLFRDCVRTPLDGLAELVGAQTLPPRFGALLQHFRDNQGLARVLVYLPAYGSMQRVLSERIETRLEARAHGRTHRVPLALIAGQIAAAQLAVLMPWILGQAAISPLALAEALYRTSNAIADSMIG